MQMAWAGLAPGPNRGTGHLIVISPLAELGGRPSVHLFPDRTTTREPRIDRQGRSAPMAAPEGCERRDGGAERRRLSKNERARDDYRKEDCLSSLMGKPTLREEVDRGGGRAVAVIPVAGISAYVGAY